MILKTLHIQNIRSYQDDKFEFKKGISLFEGDIGSGKSSILNAIEFALFGLGNQSGGHLLRVGENEGKVELKIEVNDEQIVFGRSIKRRGKRVTQHNCYIEEKGIKTNYSPTNMKKRTLQVLNFKEPTNPRSHSVIYRYAIFTPQEQMREVIRQKPDDRKQTLRKAFGIEEYSIAANNASNIIGMIRSETKVLQNSHIEAENLEKRIMDEKKQKEDALKVIQEAKKELEKIRNILRDLENEILIKKDQRQKQMHLEKRNSLLLQEKNQLLNRTKEYNNQLEYNQKDLKEAKEKKQISQQLMPLYEKYVKLKTKSNELSSANESYITELHQIDLLQKEINLEKEKLEEGYLQTEAYWIESKEKLEKLDSSLEKLPNLEQKEKTLGKKIEKGTAIQESNIEFQRKQQSIEQMIRNYEAQKKEKTEEWEKIESIGEGALCPRCHQQLTKKHIIDLRSEHLREIQRFDGILKKSAREKKIIELEISKIQFLLSELVVNREELIEIKIKIQGIKKDQETREIENNRKRSIERDIERLKRMMKDEDFAKTQKEKIRKHEKVIEKLRDIVKIYESNKKQIEELEEKEIEKHYIESSTVAARAPKLLQLQADLMLNLLESNENLSQIDLSIYETQKKLTKYENLDIALEKLIVDEKNMLQNKTYHETRLKESEINIVSIENRLKDFEIDLQRHKANLEKAVIYGIVQAWLREFLVPGIQSIEKSVLLSLNQEFNKLFKKWFSNLMDSEELQGYIDEDFTPIVEQGGYELDVESLSGGEKTSVALAYRLALNTIVKQVTDAMKSNLLILDEPTDGFSKDQLYKMRDILTELNCDQVIIVSHEQELEHVADYIYRVVKDGNSSTVIPPS